LLGQLGLGHDDWGDAPKPIGLALDVEELHLSADISGQWQLGRGQRSFEVSSARAIGVGKATGVATAEHVPKIAHILSTPALKALA
jgi:hypothetical protein